MSKVVLIANCTTSVEYNSQYDYIGVDGGVRYCLKHDIPMKCALGDFDSIDADLYRSIKEKIPTITLPVCKDISDGEYAITYASRMGYDEIVYMGGTGGRLDHFLALYHFMRTSNIAFTLVDEHNTIYALNKGIHILKKRSVYVSFFPCEPLKITLQGMKYSLKQYELKESDASFCISNEIIKECGTIEITGKVIVVESN